MKKRTGILASAVSLIFVGILLILLNFNVYVPYFIYKMVWPAFFILLGLELIFSNKLYGEENSSINLGVILLAILILIFTSKLFYLDPLSIINF
ncbi:hypothetical protein SAMN02745195_01869 [Thermoanaerobacter uzonensis DSM 18761]|jgi:hypothetical protein|uniref:LiaF transmembrane domain-containing protein n=1 Tax=Thermoanaerobacter uzonensis DSM 18761 TaxID=1123369 RepID=A0A1M4Z2E4_9THEO|nr:DUF5668 domain-containing protein [Thermoanaerobacter uzonensis]SHF11766.1 hypothetical protein SAMN02745195_01869 [Thermoanaerobacter uzonensis DSM 18761]